MKFKFLLLIAALSAYSLGLAADAVANSENSKVFSLTKTGHFSSKWIPFNLENKTFGQEYDLFDLTNESKYENLNFDSNNKLKIVALEKMIEGLISENESKFRRQNL